MRRRANMLLLAVLCLSLTGTCIPATVAAGVDPSMPAYFIAIHCEPTGTSNYPVLEEMVAYADNYHMKLTIMLTAQWADYIAAEPTRLAEVEQWLADGHEIAGHHHSIYHGSWDGYTDFPRAVVEKAGNSYDDYLGTLNDYLSTLHTVNASVQAGCANDEQSKQALPDDMVYDTCSGFANVGEPGTVLSDWDAQKGVNEFITVGTVNGITRRWLTHYQVYHDPRAAMSTIDSMDGGVYGVVTHAAHGQDLPLYRFMDYLHERDPDGAMSGTVSSIIEDQVIPEVVLADEIINAEYGDSPSHDRTSPCGDGVCDPLERANPSLCPVDCEEADNRGIWPGRATGLLRDDWPPRRDLK